MWKRSQSVIISSVKERLNTLAALSTGRHPGASLRRRPARALQSQTIKKFFEGYSSPAKHSQSSSHEKVTKLQFPKKAGSVLKTQREARNAPTLRPTGTPPG